VKLQKLKQTLYVEFRDIVRWHRLGRMAAALLPSDTCHRSRVRVLRLFGWKIGHGTVLAATPRLLGSGDLHRRLDIGRWAYLNVDVVLELGDTIDIGDSVHIGQGVSLLTTTHEVGPASCRAGGMTQAPITVGAGTWIAAGSTVLAGVTIGSGSIIAANCLVRDDVPDNCVFGGVPGRVVRMLDDDRRTVAPTHLSDISRMADFNELSDLVV
jgi:maltose O-acetyltransferase